MVYFEYIVFLMLFLRARIEKFVNAADPEKEKNIVFANSNAFQRKLIYQIVEKSFNDRVTATSQMRNNQKVVVIERKWSPEKQLVDVEKRNAEDENEYLRLVGLSAILLKISKSVGKHNLADEFFRLKFYWKHIITLQKKLIVGHNMFMDLFYLVRQFFEPLADKLKIFKKQTHRIFPKYENKRLLN